MRIALVGYGKMGKAIESIALERGHQISWVIDLNNPHDLEKISPKDTDLAIEFSQPDSAFGNIQTLLGNGVTTLSGTTGWLDRYEEAVELCEKNGATFLYASNFSIGVNLFFELNEWLAEKMATEDFIPSIEEIHHTEKKDAPSGTAITLAEGIIRNDNRLTQWENSHSKDDETLTIVSKREAGVAGTHSVTYRSRLETIQITHVAKDRKIFAEGVIKVGEWATNQKGVLTIKDYLKKS